MIPIKLVKTTGEMTPETLGLVDSGCDTTMLPAALAGVLGIDLSTECTEQPSNTAGGPTVNHVYEPGVDIIVMGQKQHMAASFHAGLPIILLGREDFFALYKIAFDQQAKTFSVEPY